MVNFTESTSMCFRTSPVLLLSWGILLLLSHVVIASESLETISVAGFQLEWTGVTTASEEGKNFATIKLQTSRGDIQADYYHAGVSNAPSRTGVVWVEGAGSRSPEGPPVTIYPSACEQLQKKQISGLHLRYRRPGFLVHCVLDTLCGIAFLHHEGVDRVILVGHSFGGAVVISAGALSPLVRGIVPMSSQTEGTDLITRVSPRPILFTHGTSDSVLPSSCSDELFAQASDPKELRLFQGAGHNLDESRQEILELLIKWIPQHLSR